MMIEAERRASTEAGQEDVRRKHQREYQQKEFSAAHHLENR